jgi:hypothetical protein
MFPFYHGFPQQALPAARRAVELDPLAQLYNWMLGWSFIAVGEYHNADVQSRVLLEIDPGFWLGHLQTRARGKSRKSAAIDRPLLTASTTQYVIGASSPRSSNGRTLRSIVGIQWHPI